MFVLLPEQRLDVSLITFSRPPHQKEVCQRIERLLQCIRLLIERSLQITEEIQPSSDEFCLGIPFAVVVK